ncbi:hypothetical protein FACS1894203_4220 [Bacteroidia bacterium]|nr:hypothetical protein FACS1894203_4220 [Bacteroidia bacterium]
MAKSELKTKQTQIASPNANGHQLEETLTIDDFSLPSPAELEAYQQVSPDIIQFLLETSVAEQKHRHKIDTEKIKVVKSSSKKSFFINWWGMFLRFL